MSGHLTDSHDIPVFDRRFRHGPSGEQRAWDLDNLSGVSEAAPLRRRNDALDLHASGVGARRKATCHLDEIGNAFAGFELVRGRPQHGTNDARARTVRRDENYVTVLE